MSIQFVNIFSNYSSSIDFLTEDQKSNITEVVLVFEDSTSQASRTIVLTEDRTTFDSIIGNLPKPSIVSDEDYIKYSVDLNSLNEEAYKVYLRQHVENRFPAASRDIGLKIDSNTGSLNKRSHYKQVTSKKIHVDHFTGDDFVDGEGVLIEDGIVEHEYLYDAQIMEEEGVWRDVYLQLKSTGHNISISYREDSDVRIIKAIESEEPTYFHIDEDEEE